ncbi:MAG: EAL domain-containing protein [Ruminococcus sp.]|jgi:diguanylate cyclase (GGDEF)-like protein/PAS domain S-box-containing protein|nr:EAL domain-containing protein [Ruminococcus sp.]
MKNKIREIIVFAFPIVLTAAALLLLFFRSDIPRMYIFGVYFAAMVPAIILFLKFGFENKKRTEKKELERLKKLADAINAPVILWDADFKYRHINYEFQRVFGYDDEDIEDSEVLHKVMPPDAFAPSLQGIINNRDEEFGVIAKNGNTVTTIWSTSMMDTMVVKRQKLYILMSIAYDLTELLQTKRDLEESEQKYSLSMQLSEIGIVLLQPGEKKIYMSDQLRSMIDVPEGEIGVKEVKSFVHRKDCATIDTIVSYIKGLRKTDMNTVHGAEIRAKSSDGSFRWYQFRYRLLESPDGKTGFGMGGSVIDITHDKEKDLLIEKMAYIDELTGIFNRNRFMQIGQEAFDCTRDTNIDYWVIVTDIDNFHIINDTSGYENGNKLLQRMASIATAQTSGGGFVARIGGDNFALLIKDNGSDSVPEAVINSIQQQLRDIKSETFKTQTITCSAGYCKMSDSSVDFSKVLDQAEFSLSMSDGSREAIVRYDNKVHETVIKAAEMEKEIALAIVNKEFVLFYQPKISLIDGSLMGMEALIRWVKPDGKLVPPVQFIPIAEKSLIITQISHFVLREACRQNKLWQDRGYPPVTVSVNLTSVDFYQTDVTASIKEALAETGLDPQYLDIELTESLALKDINNAVAQMEDIRSLGVKLSMDDFGTGYSSLSYIQILPITLLKLDRSFVMYLEQDLISREIVSAVIRVAKAKKIEVVAEGIETNGQAKILKESGCDYVQGYLFGKPMNSANFEEFMAKHNALAALRMAEEADEEQVVA